MHILKSCWTFTSPDCHARDSQFAIHSERHLEPQFIHHIDQSHTATITNGNCESTNTTYAPDTHTQWYDCVRVEIRKSVSDAIEDAYCKMQAYSTSEESNSTSQQLSMPTFDQPSLTHCARILQQRCPACFGGPMAGRTFKEYVI